MSKFSDIINHKYVKNPARRQMTMVERAAQFGAFQAVVGHSDAIGETARLTDAKLELDEYEKARLNEKLCILGESGGEEVLITFFVPDGRKSGGAYITKSERVKKIRPFERDVILEDGTIIPIDDIFAIESDLFEQHNLKN